MSAVPSPFCFLPRCDWSVVACLAGGSIDKFLGSRASHQLLCGLDFHSFPCPAPACAFRVLSQCTGAPSPCARYLHLVLSGTTSHVRVRSADTAARARAVRQFGFLQLDDVSLLHSLQVSKPRLKPATKPKCGEPLAAIHPQAEGPAMAPTIQCTVGRVFLCFM